MDFIFVQKKHLKKSYPGLSYRTFVAPVINKIIAKNRGLSLHMAARVKRLRKRELEVFEQMVGAPVGDLSIDEHTPSKDYLIRKYANVPIRDVLRVANECIESVRKLKSNTERVLLPKEYECFKEKIKAYL